MLGLREVLLEEFERGWLGQSLTVAFSRLVKGESYRAAAGTDGVGRRDLRRNAASVPGLRAGHLEAWRDHWGRAFPTVWQ